MRAIAEREDCSKTTLQILKRMNLSQRGRFGSSIAGGVKDLWIKEQQRGCRSFNNKFVCPGCFEDYAIKRWIREIGEERECTYCGRVSQAGAYRFFFLKETGDPEIDRQSPHEILDVLGDCFRNFKLIKTLDSGVTLYRARRHDPGERFHTTEERGPPPRQKATAANRMSPAGISMFYGAFDASTAVAEVCSDPLISARA